MKKRKQDQNDEKKEEEKKSTSKTAVKKKFKRENYLKPIIKWSGGKWDEISMFESHIPSNINIYLEPFIGGGSVFFYLKPKRSAISDVHKELIYFYKAIQEGHSRDIYDFMEQYPLSEENYYIVRDEFEAKTPLDFAKRFYYQRKTCFRGMLRYNSSGKFNIPYGKYKKINYSDLLNEEYSNVLKNAEIHLQSFEYLFEKYNDANNFMFLDPPYDSEFTDYGYCQFGKELHQKLAHLFKSTKIRCLMIVGSTPFIRELYGGTFVQEGKEHPYIQGEYPKRYRFKIHSGRVGNEINLNHLIIKNFI